MSEMHITKRAAVVYSLATRIVDMIHHYMDEFDGPDAGIPVEALALASEEVRCELMEAMVYKVQADAEMMADGLEDEDDEGDD